MKISYHCRSLLARVPASFWRFALFGTGGFLIDVTTLYIMIYGLDWGVLSARIPAFLLSVTFTWAMNRRYTFSPGHAHPVVEWLHFVATNLVGLTANMGIYVLIVMVLPGWFWVPAFGAAAGSVLGLGFNYCLSSRLVFSKRPDNLPGPSPDA